MKNLVRRGFHAQRAEIHWLQPMDALITNDAVVLGLLGRHWPWSLQQHLPQFKRFYTIIPTLLVCYFLPAMYNSFGLVDGKRPICTSWHLATSSGSLVCSA